MQFGKGNETNRTFTSAELAQIFNCDMKYLYYLLIKADVKKYNTHAVYTYEDYIKLLNYIETSNNHIADIPVNENDNVNEHPLVTDKRWLKLSCFPTREEITPKCFLEA